MRYDERDPESSNIEDRRGRRGGGFPFPGGGRGVRVPMGRGGLSFTTILIIGAIMLLFGINPLDLLRGGGGGGGGFPDIPQMPRIDQGQGPQAGQRNPFELPGSPASNEQPGQQASTDEMKRFVARVLADTESFWGKEFQSHGMRYQEPRLVLFSGATQTACGTGQSAMGPFYCPLDRKIYIDLSFFEELRRKFRAPGDFAQAYVVAHEVGHHVQMLLGIAEKVQSMKQRLDERRANALQVRMELQADCLAGVWAQRINQATDGRRLEPGDIEEGLNAASAIGDDMIQRRMTGRVVPDAFTHGSSEQRVRWFRRGFDNGRMQVCDTFSVEGGQL